MTKYFTFVKNALAAKRPWQVVRFTAGLGYWLFGSPPPPVVMYDSIDISQIPLSARAVAGYVGGRWPTYNDLVVRFPKAKRLSIAINATENADCLDVEKGDATIFEAPAWVKRQKARGVKLPVVYTSVSLASALILELEHAGIARSEYRLWTAHYTLKAHRCSSACGFGLAGFADATQYDDHAQGKNLDVSICSNTFFA